MAFVNEKLTLTQREEQVPRVQGRGTYKEKAEEKVP